MATTKTKSKPWHENDAFWRDLLYHLQGEGTPWPTTYDAIGIRQYGDGWAGGPVDNWRMWLRESGSGPQLVITILPEPATLGFLAFGAVALRLTWRAGKSWRTRALAAVGIPIGVLLGFFPQLLEGRPTWPGLLLLVAGSTQDANTPWRSVEERSLCFLRNLKKAVLWHVIYSTRHEKDSVKKWKTL